MTTAKITEAVENIVNRLESVKGRGEEATKQAMVLPMLDALGYDIWNPNEVCPEYEADVAIKKSGQKEKVDYAIILGGEPRIFIEVKPVCETLVGHQGQLKRYFMSTPTVSLGILTNGLEYRFFTDTGEPNIQDDDPFHVAKFDAVEQGLDVMSRFQRDVFSPESIREFATELTYTAKIVAFFRKELDLQDGEPSDDLVNWVLRSPGMYEGRIMTSVVERFKPITKIALQRVMSKVVRRIITEIDDGISSGTKEETPNENCVNETPPEPETINDDVAIVEETSTRSRREVVTTDEELECFAILKKMFETSVFSQKTIYNPGRKKDIPIEIGYKDTTAYFNIYFNKPGWWNMRIALDGKTKWVGFDVLPEVGKTVLPENFNLLPEVAHAKFRVEINTPQDLLTLTDLVHASFEKTINDREVLRTSE